MKSLGRSQNEQSYQEISEGEELWQRRHSESHIEGAGSLPNSSCCGMN